MHIICLFLNHSHINISTSVWFPIVISLFYLCHVLLLRHWTFLLLQPYKFVHHLSIHAYTYIHSTFGIDKYELEKYIFCLFLLKQNYRIWTLYSNHLCWKFYRLERKCRYSSPFTFPIVLILLFLHLWLINPIGVHTPQVDKVQSLLFLHILFFIFA